jgi:negative regulator of flagellin synthesis FlgM
LSRVLKIYAKQAAKQRRINGEKLMVAEIKNSSGGVVTALTSPTVKADKGASPVAAVTGATREDVVQLTDLGARLQTLTQSVADVPEVDTVKVAQVRQALSDGAYQIEPEVIADKLMMMEDLLGSGRSA